MLERYFQLTENGTTVRTELLAGLTTFLTLAYILFVNPLILADAGMDKGAVFVATCLASAVATLIMALYANYPIALAPGMGLNAYFAYGVVKGMGHSWEVALGAVFLSGVLFLILSVTKIREWIVDAIPMSQKFAISAGIGLFLGIIALENAGIVVAHPATIVTLGNLKTPTTVLAIIGFLAIVALDARRVPGAIIIVILALTVVGFVTGYAQAPGNIVSAPPSLAPTFLQLDIGGALSLGLVAIVFAFLFVDLFDNTGTLVGVAYRAGLIGPDGKIPRLNRALVDGFIGGDGGRGARHLDRHQLYRERRRGEGGRAHRPRRRRRRGALPSRALLRAARDERAEIRDRARPPLRRLHHGAGPCRPRLGGRDGVRARRHHGDHDAAHLLDRARHRLRLHQLRGRETPVGTDRRGEAGAHGPRRALHREIRVALERL